MNVCWYGPKDVTQEARSKITQRNRMILLFMITAAPLSKNKLSKQADVAGIDKGSTNPRHELGPVV